MEHTSPSNSSIITKRVTNVRKLLPQTMAVGFVKKPAPQEDKG